jgi:hypothetical protein
LTDWLQKSTQNLQNGSILILEQQEPNEWLTLSSGRNGGSSNSKSTRKCTLVEARRGEIKSKIKERFAKIYRFILFHFISSKIEIN